MLTKKYGFTIVELMVVIVVIAILTAITVVTYTGIQNRAQDVARLTTANQIRDKVKIEEVRNGRPSPNATERATKESFLAFLDMEELSDQIEYLGYGNYSDAIFRQASTDKTKIYFQVYPEFGTPTGSGSGIVWTYWSHENKHWILTFVSYHDDWVTSTVSP